MRNPMFRRRASPQAGERLRVGDVVEVRPAHEILATLDSNGDCERLPFMPEMLAFAGKRFRVTASAHKTCDTIHGTGGRRLESAVHLADLRCSGAAHGGCQAECLLFWKSAWLRRIDDPVAVSDPQGVDTAASEDIPLLVENACSSSETGVVRYRCQATRLFDATMPLAWWDLRQYWADVRYGNVTLSHALATLALASVFQLQKLPIGYRVSRWIYGQLHRVMRGTPDPHLQGLIGDGCQTPDARLDLKVGDVVEIRGKDEIARSVNRENRNRGLTVDEEMTTYCGGRYSVTTRVERIVNERTGVMMNFKNPCIVLDGVHCKGEYSAERLLCPRRITVYWREIWLKPDPAASGNALHTHRSEGT